MGYTLEFHRDALSEWRNLDKSVSSPIKKKLEKRLEHPAIDSARLSGPLSECFKIKHASSGHRLVYTVIEEERVVYVLAVGKREDAEVYEKAKSRL
jgi:mRNA interferase RelE/StbE